MLEVVLEGQCVFLIDDVVGIAVDLDGVEFRGFSQKLNLTSCRGRVANQELTAGPLGLQRGVATGSIGVEAGSPTAVRTDSSPVADRSPVRSSGAKQAACELSGSRSRVYRQLV